MCQSNKHSGWSTSSVVEFCVGMNQLRIKLSTDVYLCFVGSEDFKISSRCKSHLLFMLGALSWFCGVVNSNW
jgi:hypothetical protein